MRTITSVNTLGGFMDLKYQDGMEKTGNIYEPEEDPSRSTETEPFLSVEPLSAKLEAKASTHGIAASLVRSGNASVSRYGIAYAKEGGRANGGASGVAFTRKNGYSIAGDGGVAVAHHRGDAQAGFFGIAYSQNPGPDKLGRVRGHLDCLLVIGWVTDKGTDSKVVRVDGVNFEEMVWYTLDPKNNYEWVKAADQSTPKGA